MSSYCVNSVSKSSYAEVVRLVTECERTSKLYGCMNK